MSWYFDQMLALLDADDLERYKATTGPRTLCVHPAESYNSSCILPNGEIRLYGHTIGRGKGQKDGGFGYLYSHDYPYHYVKQQYLPDELEGTTFFNLSDNGYEKKIKEHFKEIGKL